LALFRHEANLLRFGDEGFRFCVGRKLALITLKSLIVLIYKEYDYRIGCFEYPT